MGKRRLYRAARAAQGASPDAPPTWGERLAALKHVPPLVRLVFQTHRGYTVSILLLRVIRSFIPVAVLWIGKLIIDAVIAGVATVRAGGLPDYANITGAGIGLDLNNSGGAVPVRGVFNATTKGVTGVAFDLEIVALPGLRVELSAARKSA